MNRQPPGLIPAVPPFRITMIGLTFETRSPQSGRSTACRGIVDGVEKPMIKKGYIRVPDGAGLGITTRSNDRLWS